ncbi:Plasmodesmata-located protein 8 [Linum perenne]
MHTTLQHLEPASSPSKISSDHQTDLTTITISLLIIILSTSPNQAMAFPQYDIYIYGSCSQAKYQQNSIFETNLKTLLSSFHAGSSRAPYGTMTVGNDTMVSSSDGTVIYGLYQCRGDLNMADCSRCVESAVDQLGLECPSSLEGSIQLEGCFIRYGEVDFLGKPDTSVRFKKCSTHVDGDVDFLRRRDDVLAELEGPTMAVNGFKVSTSGLVEGYAQCLGDLTSSGDCVACVTEAVEKLKQLCGSAAAAAEVFLGKCCARYWASGYYYIRSEPRNNDEMGKTVTIIVGVVAGLALVVLVILTLCRKSLGAKH